MTHAKTGYAATPGDAWVMITASLPPARASDREQATARGALIRAIAGWLDRHHHAVGLPNADDGRRGDVVCVSFHRSEARAALAYRTFCRDLGLAPTMRQFRVVANACARTTPPALRA